MISVFIVTMALLLWIIKQPTGNSLMMKIAQLIEKGALAFLFKEYQILLIFITLVTCLMGYFTGLDSALVYILGSITSLACGYIGIRAATKANVRTTEAARNNSRANALRISFFGGSIMGLSVATIGLLGIYVAFEFFTNKIQLNLLTNFALGASSVAFFARIGGGIYTKAADIGADLVGKFEANIPEDDPRNPATIADNVGDNVGDTAGMGADIFESYTSALISAMIIGSSFMDMAFESITMPLIVTVFGVLASLVGVLSMSIFKGFKPSFSLRFVPFLSTLIFLGSSFFLIRSLNFTSFSNPLNPFYVLLVGSVMGSLIGLFTEYFTSSNFSPVKNVALAGKSGPATNILKGLSLGMYSTVLPILLVCASVLIVYSLAGLYGIALAAVGMLATTGITIATDSYGPIVDNAGGIAEMSKLEPSVRKITDELDSLGNTTAAIGKGFAIASAALTSLALFSVYAQAVNLDSINIMSPYVFVGLFIGGIVPFIVGANTLDAVGKAAQKMVNEVRRQFREIKGLLEGTAEPEVEKCITIATKAALTEMFIPGLVAIGAPVFTGFVLGKEALGGLIAGSTITGIILALFMANAGGAWDNAKKAIEQGLVEGESKNSPAHKAAIVGDTVGDPFKDTSGPAMNTLIKMMAIIAILISSFLV
jgi:K(+)-stimulated pyrophosphate-energized sodium pump